jgi:hypothetical protein
LTKVIKIKGPGASTYNNTITAKKQLKLTELLFLEQFTAEFFCRLSRNNRLRKTNVCVDLESHTVADIVTREAINTTTWIFRR